MRLAGVAIDDLLERADDAAPLAGTKAPDRGRQPRTEARRRRLEQFDVARRKRPAGQRPKLQPCAESGLRADRRTQTPRLDRRRTRVVDDLIAEREEAALLGTADAESTGGVEGAAEFIQRPPRGILRGIPSDELLHDGPCQPRRLDRQTPVERMTQRRGVHVGALTIGCSR